jgi:ubiquinone/menaquinone biosynthesis C-methylase UbiE
MIARRLKAHVLAAAGLSVASALVAGQDNRLKSDAARVIEVLGLSPGSVVGDIGAGDGGLSLILAPHVGPSGRVYATDLSRDRLDEIRQAALVEGLTNLSSVEGHETRTNLADACCDGLVVRFVYHHFPDPPAMNSSMRDALRPGGHLVVIDFSPRGDESKAPAGRTTGAQHGVTRYRSSPGRFHRIASRTAKALARPRRISSPSPNRPRLRSRLSLTRGPCGSLSAHRTMKGRSFFESFTGVSADSVEGKGPVRSADGVEGVSGA